VTAVDDESELESIESGNLVLSATAQGTPLSYSGTDNSVQLLVQDQLQAGSAATTAAYQKGLTVAKNVIKYIKDSTSVAYALETDPSVAATKYVNFLSGAAKVAGVVIDEAKVQAQLYADLQAAEKISDANGAAQAAYAAYENAEVSFLSNVFKAAVVAAAADGAALFTGGLILGLTGVAAPVAIPLIAAVAVGWTATLPYDTYVAPVVKAALTLEYESSFSKTDFVNSYIQAHAPSPPVYTLIHGYISGATVFEDLNGTGTARRQRSLSHNRCEWPFRTARRYEFADCIWRYRHFNGATVQRTVLRSSGIGDHFPTHNAPQ
jgi:hypothetical protein